jgi:hypothetical protein
MQPYPPVNLRLHFSTPFTRSVSIMAILVQPWAMNLLTVLTTRDDEGRQYDEQGNLHDWWRQDAIDAFENKSECYVQQYAQEKEATTGLNVSEGACTQIS